MVYCFVPDCNHKSEMKCCKMFRFATCPKLRNKWIALIRRGDKDPAKSSRVCSCHFKDGDSRNLPEIFSRNQAKRELFSFPEPEKPRTRRKRDLSHARVVQVAPVVPIPLVPVEPIVPVQLSPPQFLPNSSPQMSLVETVEADSNLPEIAISSSASCEVAEFGTEDRSADVETDFENGGMHVFIKYEEDDSLVAKLELENSLQEAKNEIVWQKRQILIREAEIDVLEKEVKELKSARKGFSVSDISENPKDMAHFTGLPNYKVFEIILGLLENIELKYCRGWKVKVLSKADQLFLTLFKLRRNPSFRDLALRFEVSQATVENTFITWLSALHQGICGALMEEIPSRFKNAQTSPRALVEFTNCRIIIDITEIYVSNPKKLSDECNRYRTKMTCYALVGIAPNGTITFLSQLYPDTVSFQDIVENCGVLDKLKPGDLILSDKGSLIADSAFLPPGVSVNCLPHESTPQQTKAALRNAQPKFHVERACRVIKTFQILDCIPRKCGSFASKVFQVCGSLCNFK